MMTETAKAGKVCRRCGTALHPNAPEGLCPRCVMALNLSTETDLTGDKAGPTGEAGPKPPPATPLPAAEVAKLFPQL